jgi:hypothetical protein
MGLLGLMGTVGSYLIPKISQSAPISGNYNTSIQGTPYGGGSNTVTLGKVTDQSDYMQNTTPGGTTNGSVYEYQQPDYTTNTPDVKRMSWETAMRRAEEMYKPKYEAGVLARDKMASDQRELLAQTMAARGYANPGGGKWESGQGNITQEQAIDQQNMASSFDASKMQYANALMSEDNARADSILNQLIDQQNQQNALKQADWATAQTAASNKEQNDSDEYNNTMNWLLKLLGLEE